MIDLMGIKAKAAAGEAPLMDRPGLPIFVRLEAKAEEFPFPGFSNKLVGLSANESKSFNHKYAEDVKEENLKGQTVRFSVTVKMVRGSNLPELNDDFAKQAGPFETLQALREAVQANLASQSKAQYDDEYFEDLMEKIKEGATIKYPPQMVDHEVEHVMEDLKSRLADQKLDMAAYLKSRQMDEQKFMAEEARPIAVKRLERSLIMDEVARLEKVEVSDDILQSTFQQTWGEYQEDSGFQKLARGKTQPPKQLMNAVARESANRAYVQLTLNRLKDIATGQAPELTEVPLLEEEEKLEETAVTKKISRKRPTGAKPASVKSTSPKTRKTAKVTEDVVPMEDSPVETVGKE
jgi:trigger factor